MFELLTARFLAAGLRAANFLLGPDGFFTAGLFFATDRLWGTQSFFFAAVGFFPAAGFALDF